MMLENQIWSCRSITCYITKSYFDTTGTLSVYSKDKSTTLNAYIAYNNNFECFENKAKLLAALLLNTHQNNNNGILKNRPIGVPLECPNNFWKYH